DGWIEQVGWELLVNRQGMTWRKLTDAQKAVVTEAQTAKVLMVASPSIIKRPLMMEGTKVLAVGFDEKKWQELFL
ncbi:MAG: ArsC/Spx/MgsR family protein, partial [Saezia sp.]